MDVKYLFIRYKINICNSNTVWNNFQRHFSLICFVFYFSTTIRIVSVIISVQVILFEIDCAIFYTNLHELFCQFIS